MSKARELDHDATTRLVTDLTYLGAGPEAIKDLQSRLDEVTDGETRIVVGEIDTDSEGRPVCGLSFNCGSYEEPKDDGYGGKIPDPRAVEDLRKILSDVNLDGCLFWDPISILVGEYVNA